MSNGCFLFEWLIVVTCRPVAYRLTGSYRRDDSFRFDSFVSVDRWLLVFGFGLFFILFFGELGVRIPLFYFFVLGEWSS